MMRGADDKGEEEGERRVRTFNDWYLNILSSLYTLHTRHCDIHGVHKGQALRPRDGQVVHKFRDLMNTCSVRIWW